MIQGKTSRPHDFVPLNRRLPYRVPVPSQTIEISFSRIAYHLNNIKSTRMEIKPLFFGTQNNKPWSTTLK